MGGGDQGGPTADVTVQAQITGGTKPSPAPPPPPPTPTPLAPCMLFWFRYLRHPNIVALRGVCIEDNELYIIMNYIDGYNLE